MRRLVSVAFIVAVCAAGAVLAGAKDDTAAGTTYKIVFDNAFGLTEGGDFRVGGVNAGSTTKFEATGDSPPKAEVTAEVTEPGFADFRKDATCTIKPQSLIGEYYVDCQPGTSGEKIDNGGTVPLEQNTSTIPADLVNNILRTPYRERLRLIIAELGTGLAGRPDDLQEVLKRAHPGLRETSKTLRILGNQNRVIEDFIRDSDVVVAQLERRKQDLTRFIDQAGETAEVTASRREQLRQTFDKLPGFLDELEPTMVRLGELSDEQVPLLRDARAAAPSLNEFLTRLGPFSQASRPAVRSLGEASVIGRRAFEEGSNEVEELRRLAREVPGTAKPLRQLLESLDDDRRAIDADPRALVGGPPAGDASNRSGGKGGFTGLESFWNYFFWQGMSINGFDDIGHLLRLSVKVGQCTPYQNNTPMNPDNSASENEALEEEIEQCNQFLGPNQPGINQPDFTVGPGARALASRAGKPARTVGERRAPGQPDAGPVAGQRDISKPQVTLPPAVQDLVDRLPQLPPSQRDKVDDVLSGETPLAPRGGAMPEGGQLLDYLLAP